MAANTTPIYPGTIRTEGVALVKDAAAVTAWAAGPDGSRIDKILASSAVTGNLTISISNEVISVPVETIQIPAGEVVSIMVTDAAWKDNGSCWLANGWILKAQADQDMTVLMFGGDY